MGAAMGTPVHVVHVTHYPPLMLAALEHAPVQLDEIEAAERGMVWEQIESALSRRPGGRVDREGRTERVPARRRRVRTPKESAPT